MNKVGRWFYAIGVELGLAKNKAKIVEAAMAYPSTAVSVFTNAKYNNIVSNVERDQLFQQHKNNQKFMEKFTKAALFNANVARMFNHFVTNLRALFAAGNQASKPAASAPQATVNAVSDNSVAPTISNVATLMAASTQAPPPPAPPMAPPAPLMAPQHMKLPPKKKLVSKPAAGGMTALFAEINGGNIKLKSASTASANPTSHAKPAAGGLMAELAAVGKSNLKKANNTSGSPKKPAAPGPISFAELAAAKVKKQRRKTNIDGDREARIAKQQAQAKATQDSSPLGKILAARRAKAAAAQETVDNSNTGLTSSFGK